MTPLIDLSGLNQVPRMMSATPTGVSASQNLRGVTPQKRTGVENNARSAASSLVAIAWAIWAPSGRSVAEGVGCVIADPPPHRDGAAQFCVGHKGFLVEVPGVEAD